MRGPDGHKENLQLPVSAEKLIRNLRPVPGKSLHFMVNVISGSVYMPYFEVQGETFTCYP